MQSRLHEDLLAVNHELATLKERLEDRAARDPLTTIWNRGAIVELLSRELARSRRDRRPLAVVLADIDHFKVVNDTHGHTIGDAVIREVACRLGAGLRSAEVLGRYGGEEFLAVLYPCGRHDAEIVMERLRRQVASRPVQTAAGPIETTVSLGAAVSATPLDAYRIVDAADKALYRAKRLGRNRSELADLEGSVTGASDAGLLLGPIDPMDGSSRRRRERSRTG
jgi:diguanylate cyclase (GGDEF)-like protein